MSVQATGQNSSAGVPPSGGNTNGDENQNERTSSAASTALRQAELRNAILTEAGRPHRDRDAQIAAYLERTRAQGIDHAFQQRMQQNIGNHPLQP